MAMWSSSFTLPSSSADATNISPNVLGSMYRRSPPCMNSITTWVWVGRACRLVPRRNWPDIPKCTTSTSPSSRWSRTYFPFRSTLAIFLPASRSANSLRRAWRRMTRIAFRCGRTSTDLMRLPTTSFSRSRRITSTSGSSTSTLPWRTGALPGQPLQRLPCGLLFGLLLRPAHPPPELLPAEVHGGGELLLVVGSALGHPVFRDPSEVLRGLLLERGLVVPVPLAPRVRLHARPEQPPDHPRRDPDPLVQVDGSQHGLHGVGQDAGLVPAAGQLLALAEQHVLAQPELPGHACQDRHVHRGRPELRQLALGEIRKPPVREVRDHQAEHGVPQELEPLVGRLHALLEGERPVGERGVPQGWVPEPDPQRLLDRGALGSQGTGGGDDGQGSTSITSRPA